MRAAVWKGTSELVAPHDLSSKFLLRMRGKDRSLALALVDQPALLRHVRRAIYSGTNHARSVNGDHLAARRRVDWPGDEATTATFSRRASREYTGGAEFLERAGANHSR